MSHQVGLVLLFLGALFGTASAQEESSGEIAPDDSTRTESLIDKLGVDPEFKSTFKVNRTALTWEESVTIKEQFDALEFATDWQVNVSRNESQNSRRQQTGSGKASLDYSSFDYGGWSFGSVGRLDRRNTRTDFLRQIKNDSELGLVITSGAPGEFLRRKLGWTEDVLLWEMTGSGALTSSYNVTERRGRTEGNPVTRADSTDAAGLSRSIESTLYYFPTEEWTFSIEGALGRGEEDFDTDVVFPDSTQQLDGVNHDENESFRMYGEWIPNRDTKLYVEKKYLSSVAQDFSTSEIAQDTRTGEENSLLFQFRFIPFWGLEHDIRFSNKFVDTGWELSDKGVGKDGISLKGTHGVTLGRAWGVLNKVFLEVDWDWGTEENNYDTGNSYDRDSAASKIKIERPFGKKLVATFTSGSNLSQSYYADGKSDRDVLTQRVETNLKYDPDKTLSTKFNILWKRAKTLNIRAARSAGNEIVTNITLTADYDWALRPGMSLGQDVSVSAVSSELPFDDLKSDLVRTSLLKTLFHSKIGSKTGVRMEHQYKFSVTGLYGLKDDGTRGFAQTSDQEGQWLEGEVNYRVMDRFTMFFLQRQEFKKIRSWKELKWGGTFAHNFDKDFGFSANFNRTDSTKEDSYWKGSASVTRLF